MNPEAYYDSLFIIRKISRVLDNVAVGEAHLFAYLSCLLSLYRNRPVTEWGYAFAGTKNGSPFSAEVEDSIESLEAVSFIIRQGSLLQITPDGEREFEELAQLSMNSQRNEFLEGACSSILTLPVGVVRDAVSKSADIRKAATLGSTRKLFDDLAVESMYEFFGALSEKIGIEIESLMLPAVVWVQYLSSAKDSDQEDDRSESIVATLN